MVCCIEHIDPYLPQSGSTRWHAYHTLTCLALTLCHVCGPLLRACVVRQRACAYAAYLSLLIKLTLVVHAVARCMQKEPAQKLKMRPRTAIERVPFATALLHATCLMRDAT